MKQVFQPAVYLLASKRNGTLYIGGTSDLIQRIQQHRGGAVLGFTREHSVRRLVWFEQHATMDQAILREKRLKKWNPAWKLELIEKENTGWRDLAEDLGFPPLAPTGSRFRGDDDGQQALRGRSEVDCKALELPSHSTVTLLARLRGWSTSVPFTTATW